MNFSELKDELFARGTNYLEEDADSTARAERWLNQAYREILNLHAWPFLVTEATSSPGIFDGYVTLPDLRKVLMVTDFDSGAYPGRQLQRATAEDLVAMGVEDLNQSGTPEYWYFDTTTTTTVTTYPVGSAIRVRYIKRVDPLSGTESPIFDESYHNLIVDKAMIKAYIDNDNFEAAQALRLEYDAGVSAMAEDYLLNSREVQYIQVYPYDG